MPPVLPVPLEPLSPWGSGRAFAGSLEASIFTALGPAYIGLSPPTPIPSVKGQEAGRPPLSDETPAQGSLSLMKGSLCGAGRPLAKDKTAVCPPSLARGWGLPQAGWRGGGGHRCAPSCLSPSSLSPSQSCSGLRPLPGLPPTLGVLTPERGA